MNDLLLCLGFFLVALLFACVGQAGAPGYVGVMSFAGFGPGAIKPVALALTVLVSAIGVVRFVQTGLLKTRDWYPFALLGLPASVIGGLITLPPETFRIVMIAILLVASFQLARSAGRTAALDQAALTEPPLLPAIFAGGVIGLMAGATGIGGGLFIAMLMLALGWAPTKQVAAVAQASNLFTAAPAFAALWFTHPALPPQLPWWAVAAALGGLLGAWFGTKHLPAKTLRQILAAILLASAVRLALG